MGQLPAPNDFSINIIYPVEPKIFATNMSNIQWYASPSNSCRNSAQLPTAGCASDRNGFLSDENTP